MNESLIRAPTNSVIEHPSESQTPHIYRNQINIDNLISMCTLKLKTNPKHKKALFIRASSYMKKAQYLDAI